MRRSSAAPAKKPGRFIFLTLICGILAALIVLIGAVTFFETNRLMRQQVKPLEATVSNLMPPFEPTSFQSIDDDVVLSGWFFRASKKIQHATVILVHDFYSNRAPFDSKTADLVRSMLDKGYHVLTFDQRHSGDSEGQLTSFGHNEWLDVLGAMRYLEKTAGSSDCILYGIGTGVTASLYAWQALPEVSFAENADNQSQADQKAVLSQAKAFQANLIRQNLSLSGLSRQNIKGMILDTPLPQSDDYILQALDSYTGLTAHLTRFTAPAAIRMTGEASKNLNIDQVVADLPIPVLLILPDARPHLAEEKLVQVARTRAAIKSDLTFAVDAPEASQSDSDRSSDGNNRQREKAKPANLNDSFSGDRQLYCKNVSLYLTSLSTTAKFN